MYNEKIRNKLFQKHFDYKDENEYRVIINSKKNIDEMNVDKSLLGVLLSVVDFELEKSKIQHFENLCKLNDIDFNIIQWKYDGFQIFPKNPNTDIHKIKLTKNDKSI